MKFIKWRKREKILEINALPGDSVVLTHRREIRGFLGVFRTKEILPEKELLRAEIGRPMVINEVGIFDAEVDGRDAIGGIFINKKNNADN